MDVGDDLGYLTHGPRVLVCGPRDWSDDQPIVSRLVRLHEAYDGRLVVIHGAARGADSIAGAWARSAGVTSLAFPAQWNEHHPEWCPGPWCANGGKGCRAAGPRRNQEMLDAAAPDVALAMRYPGMNATRGTGDMIRRCQKAGVPVYPQQSPSLPLTLEHRVNRT